MANPGNIQPTSRAGAGQVFLGITGDAPLRATSQQLADLYRLGDPGLSQLGIEPLLEELLVRVREVLEVDTAAILLIDDERRFLVARTANGLEEAVEQRVRIPVGKGFAGRIAAEQTVIFIADVDQADILNPILREKGIRSLLGVPLIVEGQSIGVLHVGTLVPRVFTNGDAALLQLAATHAAPALERARLFEALEHEHRVAVALQRSLLPERLPDVTGIGVDARYLPARDEVGGDWYDVIELDRGRIGVAIGDVVGHGIRAATLMGQLRTGLRAYAIEGREPAAVLEHVDRLLQTIRGRGMATAGYAVFDPETRELCLASAGHPPPLMVPCLGEPHYLQIEPGPPLGTLAYAAFPETITTLGPEDSVLLYTDGLVEVRGEALQDGLDRLAAAVRGTRSPDALCRQAMLALASPEDLKDDVALVALQSTGIPVELLLRFRADPPVLAHVRRVLRRWIQQFGASREDVGAVTLACGEACANAIEHAYGLGAASFELEARADDGVVTLIVRDHGQWREQRGTGRGRGLTIIEASMDEVAIHPTEGGTEVLMRRRLRG